MLITKVGRGAVDLLPRLRGVKRGLRLPHHRVMSVSATEQTDEKPNTEYFPWGSMALDESGSPVARATGPLARMHTYFVLGMSESDRGEFVAATRFAFCQAARAIFRDAAKTPLSDEEAGEHPPRLEDMMDATFARRFKGVLEAMRNRGREAELELHGVEGLGVAWTDIVLGPSRELPLALNLYKIYRRMGLAVVGRELTPAQEKTRGWLDPPYAAAPLCHLKYQVAVDLACRERFVVRDRDTGALLQGHDGIQEVVHRVVMEMDFGEIENREALQRRIVELEDDEGNETQWRIVDIDEVAGRNGYGIPNGSGQSSWSSQQEREGEQVVRMVANGDKRLM